MPEEGQGTSSSGVSCPSLPGGERRPAGPGGRAGAVEGRWTASFSPPEASRALISVTAESEGARTPWGTPRAPLPPGPGGRGPGAVLQSSGRARRRGRALTGGGGGGAEQEKEEERRRKYKEKAERIIAGEDRPQVKLPAGHYLRKASVAARRRSARLNSAAQAELGVEVPTIEDEERAELLRRPSIQAKLKDGRVRLSFFMGENVPLWQQGNLLLHKEETQDERDKVKHSPQVRIAIQKWWFVLGYGAQEHVLKPDFLKLCQALSHVLRVDYSEQDALAEWELDSGGLDVMPFEQFFEGIASMCDLWTDSTDLHDYIKLLDETLSEIFDILKPKRFLSPKELAKGLMDTYCSDARPEQDGYLDDPDILARLTALKGNANALTMVHHFAYALSKCDHMPSKVNFTIPTHDSKTGRKISAKEYRMLRGLCKQLQGLVSMVHKAQGGSNRRRDHERRMQALAAPKRPDTTDSPIAPWEGTPKKKHREQVWPDARAKDRRPPRKLKPPPRLGLGTLGFGGVTRVIPALLRWRGQAVHGEKARSPEEPPRRAEAEETIPRPADFATPRPAPDGGPEPTLRFGELEAFPAIEKQPPFPGKKAKTPKSLSPKKGERLEAVRLPPSVGPSAASARVPMMKKKRQDLKIEVPALPGDASAFDQATPQVEFSFTTPDAQRARARAGPRGDAEAEAEGPLWEPWVPKSPSAIRETVWRQQLKSNHPRIRITNSIVGPGFPGSLGATIGSPRGGGGSPPGGGRSSRKATALETIRHYMKEINLSPRGTAELESPRRALLSYIASSPLATSRLKTPLDCEEQLHLALYFSPSLLGRGANA